MLAFQSGTNQRQLRGHPVCCCPSLPLPCPPLKFIFCGTGSHRCRQSRLFLFFTQPNTLPGCQHFLLPQVDRKQADAGVREHRFHAHRDLAQATLHRARQPQHTLWRVPMWAFRQPVRRSTTASRKARRGLLLN